MKVTAGSQFTQAVGKQKGRIAVSDIREQLTFSELKSRANRIGGLYRRERTGKGSICHDIATRRGRLGCWRPHCRGIGRGDLLSAA